MACSRGRWPGPGRGDGRRRGDTLASQNPPAAAVTLRMIVVADAGRGGAHRRAAEAGRRLRDARGRAVHRADGSRRRLPRHGRSGDAASGTARRAVRRARGRADPDRPHSDRLRHPESRARVRVRGPVQLPARCRCSRPARPASSTRASASAAWPKPTRCFLAMQRRPDWGEDLQGVCDVRRESLPTVIERLKAAPGERERSRRAGGAAARSMDRRDGHAVRLGAAPRVPGRAGSGDRALGTRAPVRRRHSGRVAAACDETLGVANLHKAELDNGVYRAPGRLLPVSSGAGARNGASADRAAVAQGRRVLRAVPLRASRTIWK